MRPRVPWMNEVDDAILEFFADLNSGNADIALTPGVVHYNIVFIRGASNKSRSTFSRRMSNLAKAGLLELVDEDRRLYQITGMGFGYLSGDIDATDIEEPDS